jgi:hypothetical protein
MIILEFLVFWVGLVLLTIVAGTSVLLWLGGMLYILGSKGRFSEKHWRQEIVVRVVLLVAWMLFPFSVVITLTR